MEARAGEEGGFQTGRLVALLRVYSDYRSNDPFVDTIRRDFPVVYAVRSRVNGMLRRWAEFIEKGSPRGTSAIF